MKKSILLVFIFILLLLNLSEGVLAEHEEDEDENELGEKFGVAAIGLLGVGSTYIFIRRGVLWYGKSSSKNEDLAKSLKRLFARFRSQLLLLHQSFMILATVAAIIHGLTVEREFEAREIFGWAAAITMSIISLLGLLMWKELRPFLKKVELFTPIRFIHRQWILSILLSIFLAIHLIS
ncbi:MAG: hypothetical protein GPJ54_17605 [Candidatus Heimdallarchaeota archaeon]|nr:hypothetical protein [Candidatus Heimdallarchaeota archaeon]